jgi:hypothetical protein
MAKGKAPMQRGPMTAHHQEQAKHLHPKKGDSAPKHNPDPVKHHKPDCKEYPSR